MIKHCIISFVALCMVLLALLPPEKRTFAASSDDIKAEISALEQQREELQAQIDALNGQISENTSDIYVMIDNKNSIDQQIILLQEQEATLREEMRAVSSQIAETQEKLDVAQKDYDALNVQYKERIRTMEEQPAPGYWSVLFQSSSFLDFLDHMIMLEEIAQADQRRLQQLNDAKQMIEQLRQELLTHKDNLQLKKEQLDCLMVELEEKRAEVDSILQDLLAKGNEFEAMLEESEKMQEELMAQLAQQESAYEEAKYQEWLESQKPVQKPEEDSSKPEQPNDVSWLVPLPYYTLSSPFGNRFHPLLNVWRMHNGIDMAAVEGTEIYATRNGMVTTAAYQADGAGNYVQIDHGDGYRSIYMHMTRYVVKPGQYVQAGQVIGYVGNTGLSKGSHLHFGISYKGVYVNPLEYIG